MLKLIYLAKRKPGYSFDQFVRRWRKHGALGMSLPLWRFAVGYVQAEPLRPAPFPGTSEEYDAVACYMVKDDMFSAMADDDMPGAMAMAEDELQTFSGPIPGVSLWVTEEHLVPGELGGITAYLFFADTSAARAVAEQARDAGGLNRVVLNLRDGSLGAEANTLPYSAVVELSGASVRALGEVVVDTWVQTADVAVVTREAVLWDRLARH